TCRPPSRTRRPDSAGRWTTSSASRRERWRSSCRGRSSSPPSRRRRRSRSFARPSPSTSARRRTPRRPVPGSPFAAITRGKRASTSKERDMRRKGSIVWSVVGITALGLLSGRCAPSVPKGAKKAATVSDAAAAAMKVYIAPGDLDEYYMFASGGHSGQVYVYGIPSMRHLSTIPVYTPYPATGYGFDDETKAMLGGLTWGDAHHPALSETGGDYDGRWLFINDMNGRIARIDLRDFKTRQIFGPVPNVSGNHASSFVTPNTEYAVMGSRFSIPIPKGTVAPIDKYATDYKGVVAGIKIDPKSGAMSLGWQVLMPPFDYDLGDAGKKVSDGWVFFTSYNTERATGKLEVTSTQRDRDYI